METEEDYTVLYNYIQNKIYPAELTKDNKRRLREKSSVFEIKEGELWHKGRKHTCKVIFRCLVFFI